MCSGLSYTTFNYSGLSIETLGNNLAPRAAPNASSLFDNLARVTVEITNSGSLDGTEIPQLYLGSPAAGAPNQVLRGFEAVHLAAGESTSVVFNLTRRDLRWVHNRLDGRLLSATGTHPLRGGRCRAVTTP
jgi:beta-glucosidase